MSIIGAAQNTTHTHGFHHANRKNGRAAMAHVPSGIGRESFSINGQAIQPSCSTYVQSQAQLNRASHVNEIASGR